MRKNQGFISLQVLAIMVVTAIAGAYLLKSAKNEVGNSGSYLQIRTAATSAKAGLAAAVTQLEADTTVAMNILRGYIKDTTQAWMLGTGGAGGSPITNKFSGSNQSYRARITDFDTATSTIKILSEGFVPGVGATKVTGIYKLEGLTSIPPIPASLNVLYLAGDDRVMDGPVILDGPAYFGGNVTFHPAAAGCQFNTSMHFGPSTTNKPVIFESTAKGGSNPYFIDVDGTSLYERPVTITGNVGDVRMERNMGFDQDAQLDGQMFINFAGSGTLFVNGNFKGSVTFDAGNNQVVHSGKLNVAMVRNATKFTNNGGTIDLGAKTGIPSGAEAPTTVNLAVIPHGKILKQTDLGLAGNVSGKILDDAWNTVAVSKRLGNYVVVDIKAPMNFIKSAIANENKSGKGFIFLVHSVITANSCLPSINSPNDWMFYVPTGGSITNFGSLGDFRGYVNVAGTGSVTYKWNANTTLDGAIHHVSALSGWQITGPNAMELSLDVPILKNFAALGLITLPPSVYGIKTVVANAGLNLTDVKIRPRLLSYYY